METQNQSCCWFLLPVEAKSTVQEMSWLADHKSMVFMPLLLQMEAMAVAEQGVFSSGLRQCFLPQLLHITLSGVGFTEEPTEAPWHQDLRRAGPFCNNLILWLLVLLLAPSNQGSHKCKLSPTVPLWCVIIPTLQERELQNMAIESFVLDHTVSHHNLKQTLKPFLLHTNH